MRSLEALAEKWPPSLGLFSANGTLLVIRLQDGEFPDPGKRGEIERATVAVIGTGIPNDGGDPD